MDTNHPQPAVALRHLSKSFGDVTAVVDVNLEVRPGEFLTLLGPSGSGKTTVLRMIAGFERPTAGTVELDGLDVTDVPASRRNVNTVFQDYALFPHMTVRENVDYGLKVKKVSAPERKTRVAEALESVRLGALAERLPSQLSGGQRQRVALARALVNRPKVLLLDEPLGALDLKLREELQVELKSIQTGSGLTFIYVTHDQGEALSMSDRIAVFNGGRIEQLGTPRDIYERPSSAFVAGFVGATNLYSGELAVRLFGGDATFMIRPEHVRIVAVDDPHGVVGTISTVQFLGPVSHVIVDLDGGGKVMASLASTDGATLTIGERRRVTWPADKVVKIIRIMHTGPSTTRGKP